ncbi:DNRLRE domain-containing protein [Nocardioides cavernaquae]|uniref:DNRLRE domain-containing protein n=1 Tax=Nocardioides cavernaquae TaxID=2321396 RepID=UPI0015FF2D4C|nr:DNRLRE domain-containing protein [Nocardioides cavernaquae]
MESLTDRTPSTATFANPDGTWTTEAYSGVVRSRGDEDKWVAVDPTIDSAGKGFAPKAVPYDAVFSEGGDKTLATLNGANGKAALTLEWPTTLPQSTPKDDKLTFEDAAGTGDLVLTSMPDGFNFSVVLDEAPAADATPIEYRVPLHLAEGRFVPAKDGSFEVRKDGKTLATMTAPVMWDSAEKTDRQPVDATLEGTGADRTLVLRPDMKYLTDPARVYPLTVDPTLLITTIGDTYVQSAGDTSTQPLSAELRVGSIDAGATIARSYAVFDIASLTSKPGAIVSSATMSYSNFVTGACAGTATRISQVTASWAIGNLTWATQPTTTSTGSTTSTQSFGTTGCATEGTVSFDAKTIVQAWQGGAANYGVQVKADNETAASGWRKFRSLENGDSAKAPKLSITYNTPPAVPDYTMVTPAGSVGSTYKTRSTTPTFSTTPADADGGNVTAELRIRQGSTVVQSWTSGSVLAGTQVSRTLTTALAAGSYTASWRVSDGIATSAWSTDQAFDVDLTPPTAPAMSCPNYANGSWQTTRPAPTTTCTITVSSDTQWILINDGHEWVTVPPTANNQTTLPLDVAIDSTFVFGLYAYDAAMNVSASSYTFGVGDGGFTTPTPGAAFAGQLQVNAGSPAGIGTAVLKWRAAGTSTWTTATQVKKAGTTWNGSVDTNGAITRTGDLVWDAEAETGLSAPANLEIQACFTFPPAAQTCGKARPVTLVAHAFGRMFPTATVGPAEVALLTGEYQHSETDVSVPGYRTDLSVARTFQSLGAGARTPAESVFGPGWVANLHGPQFGFAGAQVVDSTAADGTITLLDTEGSSSVYKLGGPAAQAVGVYLGQGETAADNDKLELKTGTPKTLTLTEEDGTVTTWTHAGGTAWKASGVKEPSTAPSVTYGYTGPSSEYVSGIYSGPPGVTCNATTQARGCRALVLTYTGTGTSTRLAQVDLKIWDPKPGIDGAPTAAAAMVTVPVAKYSYDANNRLASVWDPRLDYNAGANHVATSYGYTTIAGRTHLASLTPPGEKTWTFTLNATTGKFEGATRAQDAAVGGTATWAVKYDLAISGSGLPDLTGDTSKAWGQKTIPAAGAAVFGPDAPGTTDYTYADLTYFTADGKVTNTASYGAGAWLIDTVEYDSNGNQTWSLDAAARASGLATGSTANQIRYYNGSVNVYSADGTRLEQSYSPIDWVVRNDRSSLWGRQRVDYLYDDEATAAEMPGKPATWTPADTPRHNVVIKTTSSVADMANATADAEVTWNRYQPVVAGDGDGWILGQPTRVSTSLGGGWSTTLIRFTPEAKVVETRTPQGVAALDGAGSDARSRIVRYYTADGSSPLAACRNKPEWVDAVCSVGPAGGSAPTTTSEGFDYIGGPTRSVETAGTTQRISVTTRDSAGRATKDAVTSVNAPAGQVAVPDKTYGYEQTTGALNATTGNGQTAATTVDTWGRTLTQTDGSGNTGTSTYNAAGNLATFNDGKGTYTYTYDGADANGKTERRGLLTKLDVGLSTGPDLFTAATDADGNLTKVVYPNGVVRTSTFTNAGAEFTRTYENAAGADLVGWTMYRDVDGRVRLDVNTLGYQWYDYDQRGRLTKVEDGFWNLCTTRIYGFSLDSNRNTLTSYAPGAGGACQTTTPSSTVNGTFDGDDKKTDTGYVYDTLGRTTTLPGADTVDPANGNLTATYYANDLVASLTRPNAAGGAQGQTWGLDANGRLATMSSTTAGVELRKTTNHYAGGSDSPAWQSTDTRPDAVTAWTNKWTRNVTGIDGGLALLANSTGGDKIQLANPHGDVTATMANTVGAASLETYSETTEYGLYRPQAPAAGGQYGWLGSKLRSGDALAGLTLMGVRLYNPATGRFLTRDPVYGGNDNAYVYPADPINAFDLDGLSFWSKVKSATKSTVKFVSKHKVDIALTAVSFIPAGAAARGAYMAYKGVRAVQAARKTSTLAKAAKSACSFNSFDHDTPVLMADGTLKPISEVELGDSVWAADPATGEEGPRVVVDLIRHAGIHTMVAIRLADGTMIDATDGHPFWVEGRAPPGEAGVSGAWVNAIDLAIGDWLLDADGQAVQIEGLAVSINDLTAYNLTVADLHTYHVGTDSILVHNHKCEPGGLTRLSKSFAKQLTKRHGTDPEAFKAEYVGARNGGRFDLAKCSCTRINLISKNGRVNIPTWMKAD